MKDHPDIKAILSSPGMFTFNYQDVLEIIKEYYLANS